MTLKQAVAETSTAQMRRVTIPLHRRKMQAKQTVIGIAVGIAGMLFVKWMGLSEGWYVAAALLGARIASKEYLKDAVNIIRELLGGAVLEWGKVDLALLDKDFRKDVEDFLSHSPYRWWVTYGYRSLDEQAALYKVYQSGGPRAAPAGRSAHNFGLAVDVVLDQSDAKGLQAEWTVTMPGWLWLKAKSIAHPRLRTGWAYADYGHLESVNWKAIAKAKGY